MSRASHAWRRWDGGRDRGRDPERAFLAEGAANRILAGESTEEVLPRFARRRWRSGRSRLIEELPRVRDEPAAPAIGEKAEVSDTDEAAGQDVLDEAT